MSAPTIDDLAALAARLPAADVAQLVGAATAGPDAVADLRARLASPTLREACDTVLAAASGAAPGMVAGVLAGAAAASRQASVAQTIDVVWTGPESDVRTSRLTAPVIVDLIDSAAAELLLVSYATYDEPHVASALHRAAERGIDITLLLERHADNPAYSPVAEAFSGLAARRWCWPIDHRPYGAALHAKIVVVDSAVALLGSANLTGRAIGSNLECGVLIRAGAQPRAIREHVWGLRRRGVIEDRVG